MKGSFDIGAEYYAKYHNLENEDWREIPFDTLNGIPIIHSIQKLDKHSNSKRNKKCTTNVKSPSLELYAKHEAFREFDSIRETIDYKIEWLCTIDLTKLKDENPNYCYEYYFGKKIAQFLKVKSYIDIWERKCMLGFLERYLFSFEQVRHFNATGEIDFSTIDPVYGNLEYENTRSRSLK